MKNQIRWPGVAIIALAVWSVWAGQSALFSLCLVQIWFWLDGDDRIDDKSVGAILVCNLGVSGLLGCMVTGFTGMLSFVIIAIGANLLSIVVMAAVDDDD